MDKDTRDFILGRDTALTNEVKSMRLEVKQDIDAFRIEVRREIAALSASFNDFNIRLGKGSEKFESIEIQFKNNDKVHKLILWVIGIFSSLTIGVILFLLNGMHN